MKKTVLILAFLVSLKSLAATAGDNYHNAVQAYQQGLYTQGAQYCQAALQEDPQNWRAYQVLCSCDFKLGLNSQALAAADQSLKIQPSNPPLQKFEAYLQSLQPAPTLPAPALPVAAGLAIAKPAGPPPPGLFSLRVFTLISKTSFPDLVENANTLQAQAAQAQALDTSTRFSAQYPTDSGVEMIEPTLWLNQSWQVGLPFSIYNISSAPVTQNSNSQGNTNASFNPTAFCVGLSGRYMLRAGGFQFDAAAGPMMAFMGLDYTGGDSAGSFSGNFSAAALGLEGQLSASLELFNLFTIGPTLGYQAASATGFHGSVSGAGIPSVSGTWEMVPGPSGTALTILPNGTSAPSGSRPFKMDISGLNYGCQLTMFF